MLEPRCPLVPTQPEQRRCSGPSAPYIVVTILSREVLHWCQVIHSHCKAEFTMDPLNNQEWKQKLRASCLRTQRSRFPLCWAVCRWDSPLSMCLKAPVSCS